MSNRTLEELETEIETGIKSYQVVGRALMEIHDRQLYKKLKYDTFDTYVFRRWHIDPSRAYQLMNEHTVSTIVETLRPDLPVPDTEAQARELAVLRDRPDDMVDVWAEVVEETDGNPTARAIRGAVKELDGGECLTPKYTTLLGSMQELANLVDEAAPLLKHPTNSVLLRMNWAELDQLHKYCRDAQVIFRRLLDIERQQRESA